jgi:stage III sporulation protein AA
MSQGEVRNLFKHEIMPLLAPAVRRLFSRVEPQHLLKVEEIRMRSGQPLIIRGWDGEYGLDANNGLTHDINRSYRVSGEDIIRTIAVLLFSIDINPPDISP